MNGQATGCSATATTRLLWLACVPEPANTEHLLRNLVFVEAHFRFHMYPLYINTLANHLADDLSRNCISSFLSKVPQAHRSPSPVPAQLLSLLLNPQAEWTSLQWRRQFSAIFDRA